MIVECPHLEKSFAAAFSFQCPELTKDCNCQIGMRLIASCAFQFYQLLFAWLFNEDQK